uniref:NADH-ubiquinone oxidoreductase chain 5 n=1 Tax=Falcidens halanychi TaxID=370642 RepID=A0A343X883_9MOLL|nr:NADH dehydrogenase subunit 5 [Falcidens halanychi]AWH02142.1 NADH dehydrogenase subunit 5 [Falcidens halanychi]
MKYEKVFEKSYFFFFLFFLVFTGAAFSFFSSNSVLLFTWLGFSLNSTVFEFSIILDFVSLLFGGVVVFISMCVMMFSESYMSGEFYKSRFNWLVMLFVLSMNFMIFVPNLMAVLLGWDGLGLVSFVLIIYYQSYKSYNAGMLTALTNRVGDVFLLLTIVWLVNSGQWCFLFLSKDMYLETICLCIMLAGMTKSAQIPFSSWLPAAMAAPTPVSALVHSSTLVTAGVFLLIRFFPMLTQVSYLKESLFFVGSMTMLMAGFSAIFEYDMKKIIALSTLSQLGVMILSLGLGVMELAYFHLLTHALFKALFFVCAGSLIHCYSDNQDVRLMGSLFMYTPVTSVCVSCSIMALCGAPFLAGFYSKDLIIEMILVSNFSFVSLVFLLAGTVFTVFYSVKFFYFLFWKDSDSQPYFYKGDNGYFVVFPMCLLALGSIFSGNFFSWVSFNYHSVLFLPSSLKSFTWVVISVSFFLVLACKPFAVKANLFFYWVSSLWFMVPISTQMVIIFPLAAGSSMYKALDQGWNELLGPKGLYRVGYLLSGLGQSFQYNPITIFLFIILFFSVGTLFMGL